MTAAVDVEYQHVGCDLWQVARICNFMAGHGWEPVTVGPGHEGQLAPRDVRDLDGPSVVAAQPMVVLFRRPIPKEEG